MNETAKALYAEMNRNIQLQEEIERLKETCDFWIGKVRFFEQCLEKDRFTDISGREFISVEVMACVHDFKYVGEVKAWSKEHGTFINCVFVCPKCEKVKKICLDE